MEVRILVWHLPRILREIVQEILTREPDFHVVTPAGTEPTIHEAINEHRPDAVIASGGIIDNAHREERFVTGLLNTNPRLRLVMIRDNGRNADLWEMRPVNLLLKDISPDHLVTVIRNSVRGTVEMRTIE